MNSQIFFTHFHVTDSVRNPSLNVLFSLRKIYLVNLEGYFSFCLVLKYPIDDVLRHVET